jgi:hypothetical protein
VSGAKLAVGTTLLTICFCHSQASLRGGDTTHRAGGTVEKRIADLGQMIPPKEQLTPKALYDFHKAETVKWWPIIKAAGIKTQ